MLREDDALIPSPGRAKNRSCSKSIAALKACASMLLFYHVTDVGDADRLFELEFTPRTRIMGRGIMRIQIRNAICQIRPGEDNFRQLPEVGPRTLAAYSPYRRANDDR